MNEFLIPGVDPAIEIHGGLPPLCEIIPSIPTLEVHDLRGDPMRFGDDANRRVIDLTPKISRFWMNINHAVASAADVEFDRHALRSKGARVLALSNVVSHDLQRIHGEDSLEEAEPTPPAEASESEPAPKKKGTTPKVSESRVHYSGKTGFAFGRSAFNYYHFLMDTLPMVDVLLRQADELGLDRIIVNPCEDEEGGFQREIVDTLWPDWSDRIHFSKGPFYADHLTWCCIWPSLFRRNAAGAIIVEQTPKGAAGRMMRQCQAGIFERADRWRAENIAEPAGDQASAEIVLISRKAASQRRIENEDDLFERLKPFGAIRVQMEQVSFPDKLRLMGQAKVVIGPHGAGLINAGFCRPGSSCIEITSRTYLPRATWVSKIAWLRNMQYHLAITDEAGDKEKLTGNTGNDLLLSQAAIDRIVDLAAASVSK